MPELSFYSDLIEQVIWTLRDPDQILNPTIIHLVHHIFFGNIYVLPRQIDFCLVLGSRNCEYRVKTAFEYFGRCQAVFVLTGGGFVSKNVTEAEYMKTILLNYGVKEDNIAIESSAGNTIENIKNSLPVIIKNLTSEKITTVAVVTGGFHMRRTLAAIDFFMEKIMNVQFFGCPAFGKYTSPDHWHQTMNGRIILSDELEKIYRMGLLNALKREDVYEFYQALSR